MKPQCEPADRMPVTVALDKSADIALFCLLLSVASVGWGFVIGMVLLIFGAWR